MGYAFISYSVKKKEYAYTVKKYLTQNNIDTWMAPESIPFGHDYPEVINKAIKGCSCLILILTEEAQQSEWVKREVDRAINYKKPLLSILMDDVALGDTFEFFTSISQSISVSDNFKNLDKIRKILSCVGEYTGYMNESEVSDKLENKNSTVIQEDEKPYIKSNYKSKKESEKENSVVPKGQTASTEKKLTFSASMDLDREYNRITKTFNIPYGYTYITKLGLEPYSLYVECLIIPQTVIYIDPEVFKSCSHLKQIKIHKDNPNYESINNKVIDKTTNTIIWKRW